MIRMFVKAVLGLVVLVCMSFFYEQTSGLKVDDYVYMKNDPNKTAYTVDSFEDGKCIIRNQLTADVIPIDEHELEKLILFVGQEVTFMDWPDTWVILEINDYRHPLIYIKNLETNEERWTSISFLKVIE